MQSFVPMPQALKYASYIPAQPAEIVSTHNPSNPSFAGAPLDIQIGEGPVNTFTPDPGDTHALFFARVATSGLCVDEDGKNPLSIAVDVNGTTFRSGARMRFKGIFAFPYFFGEPDVSPIPARVFDTTTDHVRHGEEVLAETIGGLAARYTDPRTTVIGQRAHPPFATLVSLGATIGDTIEVYHGSGYDVFTIDAAVTAIDFVAFVQNSQALNTAFGNRVDAYIDAWLQNVVVFSKTRQQLSIQATRTATFAAVFGSLPT